MVALPKVCDARDRRMIFSSLGRSRAKESARSMVKTPAGTLKIQDRPVAAAV